MLLQRAQAYPEGTGLPYRDTGGRFGHWGRSYPEHVTNSTLLGLSEQDLMSLAVLIPGACVVCVSAGRLCHVLSELAHVLAVKLNQKARTFSAILCFHGNRSVRRGDV